VSGPTVPPTSLLTPLRAESCSAIGQSSTVAAVVDGEVGVGVGDVAAVGVADALAFADGAADAEGLPEEVARAVGVGEADGEPVGDTKGEPVTRGVPPCPLHAQSSAAEANAVRSAREKRGNGTSNRSPEFGDFHLISRCGENESGGTIV
jgi:hypothetical protein